MKTLRRSFEAGLENELVGKDVHVGGIDICRFTEGLPCFFVFFLADIGHGLRVLGIGCLRRQTQGFLEVRQSVIFFFLRKSDESAVVPGLRELRIELEQGIVALERGLLIALALLCEGQIVVGSRRFFIVLHSLLEI